MPIEADWSGSATRFLATDPAQIGRILAHATQRRHPQNHAQQLRAWAEQCVILATALQPYPAAADWHVLLEVSLPRTPRRADAVLLAGSTIIVLEFKIGATQYDNAARAQVEDFALDLQDFHAGSRNCLIVPILVASAARPPASQASLLLAGAASVHDANATTLPALLQACANPTAPPINPAIWQAAPYRPVPPIIDAARSLYARHAVEDILDTRAGTVSLSVTSAAITQALQHARQHNQHVAIFVTGVPGAGKTLCGLNACFGAATDSLRATFLTGNPSLVHVLREALVRDAVAGGMSRPAAEQRMHGVIQALPAFRDNHARTSETPPERVVVIDEAQRSWSRDHAIRKSRDREVRLTDSEPGHLLHAMGRHPDWSALICLVGQGQEIHDGEGGLAEWGIALAAAPSWQVVAAPDCLTATDPRRRLPPLAGLRTDPRLHLTVPTRQIGHPAASDWVDAVLAGNAAAAATIAGADPAGLPYTLTRDLHELRAALRATARGTRRAGLVASSGARRLRAEGLGTELPHMDAGAVARWFLDRWPDVRAADALEVVATEFSAQGLELDVVGLCWDTDLIRDPRHTEWQVRRFRGTAWERVRAPQAVSNRINTYRVLLTRARHATIIYIPRGDTTDATRNPALLDAIAAYLTQCGLHSCSGRQPPPMVEHASTSAEAGGGAQRLLDIGDRPLGRL